ncbi:MAG: histidine phosphatase family protein, partial [Lachnospiraceae bacterium]|nr:histidine phosphatase family protein [Lachnospiraceae bacterium]
MKLYIIRHGETEWNKEKRLQGRTDIPLSAEGERIAKLTAEGMRDIKLDYIFSSPLNRAYTTAKY